jgi:hypothetical protein
MVLCQPGLPPLWSIRRIITKLRAEGYELSALEGRTRGSQYLRLYRQRRGGIA